MIPKNIQKYLDKTAYKHWALATEPKSMFELIVVIPLIDEFNNIPSLVKSLEDNNAKILEKSLFLFIVNNLKSTDKIIKENNLKTIKYFEEYNGNLNISYVDSSTEENELPEKDGGVGVARKIGMDLALKYFNYQSTNKKIIVALDGDCTVESNYISTIYNTFNKNNLSAGYVNFAHSLVTDEENLKAIICYEIFLRYYVLGLQYANSPYAFHTIGSTMACDAESYVKAGGMNKRKAAEDFYFMEKLSKSNKIVKIDGTSIYPSARGSWRVPFGTGQRVNRYLAHEQDEYKLYSPENFTILKQWVDVFYTKEIKTADEYLEQAKNISKFLQDFLELNSFSKSWNKILENTKSEVQINKQKQLWFDGFRTLKLIHFLRDNLNPNENMFYSLDKMFEMVGYEKDFHNDSDSIPSIKIQQKYLTILREIS